MKHLLLIFIIACLSITATARNVSIKAANQPAATVFRNLIEQTGMNFVYSSELLANVRISVNAKDKPLKNVLDEIFTGTGIEYKIKGDNVILKRKAVKKKNPAPPRKPGLTTIPSTPDMTPDPVMLNEVVIVSRLDAPAVNTAEIGARKVTGDDVRNTPVIFGEADVIKSLHTLPGVTEGSEGMAGMNVHGGNADENLYMLDNVPMYQVNHFAGLFSAFNPDIIRYIDFFKSSMPAKYEGRLSSFMDVRLRNGNRDGHQGSARLGLTSGAFNISGPVGEKTTYLFGLRRSWYDVLTIPALAIINRHQDEKVRFHYYFMDMNAKVAHRFSGRANLFLSVYFGDDLLRSGTKDDDNGKAAAYWFEDDKHDLHWGNLMVQAGLNYRFSSKIYAEFTAAYTRFFSDITHHDIIRTIDDNIVRSSDELAETSNNINDWIFRGDFDWQPNDNSRVRFGANYVRHSFLPARTSRRYVINGTTTESRDSTWNYGANEFNTYIEDDWTISGRLHVNAGVHASLFCIDKTTKHGLSPRISLSYNPSGNVAVKGAYSRTTQYVHQLSQSYLALPTDQWIPVTGKFKPQTADIISAGIYWQSNDGDYTLSAEGYYKWMRNVLEYRDEYYLHPPLQMWNSRLTSGRGTAKGIDFMIEKKSGRLTGHIAYSLAWTDRTFPDKNSGHTYPARFDNRHTINVLVNWNINEKVQLNASWTGHSGNRFTLMPQMWETPPFGTIYNYSGESAPLQTPLNNYQLPFYHRLDLSCTVRNRHGYWTFSVYNAYNHMNTVGIKRGYSDYSAMTPDGIQYFSKPAFQKIKLLPVIPSISYTWQF